MPSKHRASNEERWRKKWNDSTEIAQWRSAMTYMVQRMVGRYERSDTLTVRYSTCICSMMNWRRLRS